MTKANEHLDRAINAADHKVKELYDQKQKRRHARALVAELLSGMEPIAVPDQTGLNAAWDAGYNAALFDLKSIAGQRGEG